MSLPARIHDRPRARAQRCVVGIHSLREARVGLAVFVGAAHQGSGRKGRKPLQRGVHLGRIALEEAAAAEAEQGISTEQVIAHVVAHMRTRVAGCRDHTYRRRPAIEIDPFTVRDRLQVAGDSRIDRREAGEIQTALQLDDASGVVGMVVGDEDGREFESTFNLGQHHLRIAWVDDNGACLRRVRQPEVVVVEGGQG